MSDDNVDRKELLRRQKIAAAKAIDLRGQRFGYLVALEPGPKRGRLTTWDCLCTACWGRCFPTTLKLRRGLRKSCGCMQHPRWQTDPRSYYDRNRDRLLTDHRIRIRVDPRFAVAKRALAARWAKENPDRYLSRQRRLKRAYVSDLASPYLKAMIAQQIGGRGGDVPQTFVQVKRAHLLVARKLREERT